MYNHYAYCTFIQIHKMYKIKSKFCPGGLLITEERQGVYGKSLYLPFNFTVNLKLL